MWIELIKALEQTIYMTIWAAFIASLIGIPLGVLMFCTRKGMFLENTILNRVLSAVVNALRSIPMIILMIAIIPFTRFIVGTSIGTTAAIVPLTVAAIPFLARLCNNSFEKVPAGLIEAGLAMGASPKQIILKILLPEAKPFLIQDITVTLVSLISYSAMAGTIGGGGLGSLAIHYGYQRFDAKIMLLTVIVLIILVQTIQAIGDLLVRNIVGHKK